MAQIKPLSAGAASFEHRLASLVSHSVTYTYDYYPDSGGVTAPTRLLRKLTLPPGSYITNRFDTSGRQIETRLMTSAHAELNDHAYLYNMGNQRTQQTFLDDSYVTYTYDDAGQLRTAYTTNSSGAEITAQRYMFGYDAAWNMTKRTNNATVTTYIINNLNQNTTFFYDSNGNPTGQTLITYIFDDENRLISVDNYHSAKVEFFYDARGRIRKRLDYTWIGSGYYPPTETRYVYDGMLMVQERNSSNGPQINYTRGPDLSGTFQGAGGIGGMLARSTGYTVATGAWGTHQFYHADANGNITYLMTSAQALGASYRYDPFGRTITSSGTSATANTYRFSSKQIDAISGFYYYGYRFYDPNSQRWLNRDLMEENDGPNLYSFLGNQPTDRYDMFGLFGIPVINVPEVPIPLPDLSLLPDTNVRDCAERIRAEVARDYCGWPGSKKAPDDKHCREAHCIASCRISQECLGGAVSSFVAGWVREIGHWAPDSWGDAWANTKGICKSLGTKDCEKSCKGAR